LNRFDFFPRKLACVFEDKPSMERYIWDHSLEELLKEDSDKVENPEMSSKEIASVLAEVEVGDFIRFDGQENVLEVVEKNVTWETRGDGVTGVKAEPVQGSTKVFSKDGDWYARGANRYSIKWVEKVEF
jgi:hypothetical protein